MPPRLTKGPGPLSKTRITPAYKCTACEASIKTTFDANIHPLIGCLICRACNSSYGNGDFASWEDGVDDQGDDNYCRWCCDGGELFGCMNDEKPDERCHYSFCKECIKRNVPEDEILKIDEIEEEEKTKIKWLCYVCNKEKLKKLRNSALAAMKNLNDKVQKTKSATKASSSEATSTPASASTVDKPTSSTAKASVPAPASSAIPMPAPTPTKALPASPISKVPPASPTSKAPASAPPTTPTTKPAPTPTKAQSAGSTTKASTPTPASGAIPMPAPTPTKAPPASPMTKASASASTPATTPKPAQVPKPVPTPTKAPPVSSTTKASGSNLTTTSTAIPMAAPTPTKVPLAVSEALPAGLTSKVSAPAPATDPATTDKPDPTHTTAAPAGPTAKATPQAPSEAAIPMPPPTPTKAPPASPTVKASALAPTSTSSAIPMPAPTPRLALAPAPNMTRASDLTRRLTAFKKTKDVCIEEINDKFNMLNDMAISSSSDKLLTAKIESFKRPIRDLENILTQMTKIIRLSRADTESNQSLNVESCSYKMSQQLVDEDDKSLLHFKEVKEKLKKQIINRLEDYDWIEQMKLKGKSYIENSGTKTTTIEEVRDYLLNEAKKTFPQSVREEMSDEVDSYLEDLALSSV